MSATLRLSRTHFPVTALGFGRRLGIWVQGCPLACAGCMARDTWEPAAGVEVPVDELIDRWRECLDRGADGVTISGGEPLTQPEALAALVDAIDATRAGRDVDIMVYTGYDEEELDDAQRDAVARVDVLVTGRFRVAEPTTLIWRGSANQRLLPRTELGRRRYEPFVDHSPEHPPMQVAGGDGGVWLVGVPRPGTLAHLERQLRRRGLPIDAVTWRPAPERTGAD